MWLERANLFKTINFTSIKIFHFTTIFFLYLSPSHSCFLSYLYNIINVLFNIDHLCAIKWVLTFYYTWKSFPSDLIIKWVFLDWNTENTLHPSAQISESVTRRHLQFRGLPIEVVVAKVSRFPQQSVAAILLSIAHVTELIDVVLFHLGQNRIICV